MAESFTERAIIGRGLVLRARYSPDDDVVAAGEWSRSQCKGVEIAAKAAPRMSNEEIGRLEFANEPRRSGDQELANVFVRAERNHGSVPRRSSRYYPLVLPRWQCQAEAN